MATESRSRARSSIACDRRPGSNTKLASMESYVTPASSTPARRSTRRPYFTSCPAFGTRASSRNARTGASASLASGGRLRGAAPPASSPSGATWAKGRYHERPGATASDIPTSSARIGSGDVAPTSKATSGAARHSATAGARAARSSRIVGSACATASVGGARGPETGGTGPASGAGSAAISRNESLGIRDRNSSSVKSSVSRATSGGPAPARVQERDTGSDELIEILVARHDHHPEPARRGRGGHRPDDVVRLVALRPDQREVERIEDLHNALHGAIEVLLQLPRKFLARRLVPGVGLVPEGLAHVVHPGEIVGPPSLEQAQQEVGDPPRRRSILAPTRGEGARDHREERAVDERVSVDQIEGGWGFRHAPKNNARWNEKPRPMEIGRASCRERA